MAVEGIIIVLLVLILIALYRVFQKLSERPEDKTAIFGKIMKELGGLKKGHEISEKETGEIKKQVLELKKTYEAIEKEREKGEEARTKREEQRTEQLNSFLRIITGTKKRGIVGEEILKQSLTNAIKSGLVKTNLRVDNKEVEFAWNLGDGKYIPIDAKLPDVIELFNKYNEEKDPEVQKAFKKKIGDKIKKHMKEITVYKNKRNTIDKCILAIPDGILDILPELTSEFKEKGIVVSGYTTAFLNACLIDEDYHRTKEKGDIGTYKQFIEALLDLMRDIEGKSNSMDRSITAIENANKDIKKLTLESERFKLSKR